MRSFMALKTSKMAMMCLGYVVLSSNISQADDNLVSCTVRSQVMPSSTSRTPARSGGKASASSIPVPTKPAVDQSILAKGSVNPLWMVEVEEKQFKAATADGLIHLEIKSGSKTVSARYPLDFLSPKKELMEKKAVNVGEAVVLTETEVAEEGGQIVFTLSCGATSPT